MKTHSFQDVFGNDFGSDRAGSRWDKPFFDNRLLKPEKRFVAWVDLMGAENHMLTSLPQTACFVGKIHDAGLQAQKQFTTISLHPIADGFYAVSSDWNVIRKFTARVMRSLAYLFDIESENRHRFLPRAGIAYGRFIDGKQMAICSDTFKGHDEYLQSVFVGCPLVWSHRAESKAPPFGIYVDQSIPTHSDVGVSFVLLRWWTVKDSNEKCWAAQFGKKVEKYFEWLNQHHIETRYPYEKHEKYMKAVKEYFGT